MRVVIGGPPYPGVHRIDMNTNLPSHLWAVRHGQSSGNVARDRAVATGSYAIDIAGRDMDVPLSALGRQQAEALGRWFGQLPASHRPEVIFSSPYLRAKETADAVRRICPNVVSLTDERLREKEFGILDRLTKPGIEAHYPEQARLRESVGKFYFRPPSGENWCDVILRLRSLWETICLHHAEKRVLVIGHQVVVLCLRYIIEELDEKALLDIDAAKDVANCAITEYGRELFNGADKLSLRRYNFAAPLIQEGTPVTAKPDTAVSQ
jgi:probable phosphoglycerate mutase